MNLEQINSLNEKKHLNSFNMLFGRDFMVTILDENDKILFYPCMISNFSVDSKKIFVTLYDIIVKENIEEALDSLLGNFIKKPRLKIVLSRLDKEMTEIYHVNYTDCKLKNYHGKNFTYKVNEAYQWYLEFTFGNKEIVKSTSYNFKSKNNENYLHTNEDENDKTSVADYRDTTKFKLSENAAKLKYLATLKSSNEMLDNAMDTVRKTKKIKDYQKNNVLNQIENAKEENKKTAKKTFGKYYGGSLDSLDFNQIQKTLEKEMEKLEDKINK